MSLEFDPNNPLRFKRKAEVEGESKDEEELLLEQDIEGNSRKRGRRQKKIDSTQYDDDSSDEEPVEPEEKEKDANEEDDDDSDMFGSDDDDEDKSNKSLETRAKASKVQLMNLEDFDKENEIEGDVNDEESDVVSPEEEEEEEEADDALDYYNNPEERRTTKKVPKNEPRIDAFNLKNENKEGRFDLDGNFIPIEGSDEEQTNNDDWLLGVKKKDIKRARIAQENRENKEQSELESKKMIPIETLLFELITLLEPVESPLEALQRLNKKKPKHKKRSAKVNKSEEEIKREKEVISITEYSESLIEKGFKNVYELEKEELMLKYKQESGKNYIKPKTDNISSHATSSVTNNSEESLWQFKWVGDTQVHGPYSLIEILYWKDNYFNGRAEIKKVGDNEFIHIDKATFD